MCHSVYADKMKHSLLCVVGSVLIAHMGGARELTLKEMADFDVTSGVDLK